MVINPWRVFLEPFGSGVIIFLPKSLRITFKKSYFKLTFYIDIRGGETIEFKNDHKEAFNIVGVKATVPIQFEGENNHIANLAKFITKQQKAEIHQLTGLYPNQVVNASYKFDGKGFDEKGERTHMIDFLTTEDNTFGDLEQVNVEKHTWVIFPNKGSFLKHCKIHGRRYIQNGYHHRNLS
ncbi:GyrI-like domain-containing protein [Ruoffia sp. FAM 20858]|uniref:GyrI-like domain-containing protein n=1 Tax=Ruoffia sp. FAM 20858 TaxID=3259516 RepID=UPI00388FC953